MTVCLQKKNTTFNVNVSGSTGVNKKNSIKSRVKKKKKKINAKM